MAGIGIDAISSEDEDEDIGLVKIVDPYIVEITTAIATPKHPARTIKIAAVDLICCEIL